MNPFNAPIELKMPPILLSHPERNSVLENLLNKFDFVPYSSMRYLHKTGLLFLDKEETRFMCYINFVATMRPQIPRATQILKEFQDQVTSESKMVALVTMTFPSPVQSPETEPKEKELSSEENKIDLPLKRFYGKRRGQKPNFSIIDMQSKVLYYMTLKTEPKKPILPILAVSLHRSIEKKDGASLRITMWKRINPVG